MGRGGFRVIPELVFAVGLSLGAAIGMVALVLWSGWRGRVVRREREAEKRKEAAKLQGRQSKHAEFDSQKLDAWLKGGE